MKDDSSVISAHGKGLHPILIGGTKVFVRMLRGGDLILKEVLVNTLAHDGANDAFGVGEVN